MVWFPSHPIPEDTLRVIVTNLPWDVQECVTDAFLNLAREQHTQGYMDAVVQIGLGICNKFDRAKDCFDSALSMRRKVCARCDVGWIRVGVWFIFLFAVGLLWNRLGSLSNEQAGRGAGCLPRGTPVAADTYPCVFVRFIMSA